MMGKSSKDSTSGENMGTKRKRGTSPDSSESSGASNSIMKLLSSFSEVVTKRLDNIENRLCSVMETCDALEKKVEQLSTAVIDCRGPIYIRSAASPGSASSDDSCPPSIPIGSNITLITLNTEDAYPNGAWLGDECNPEQRVRCHISRTELFHINTTCNTPEKMALTLLDYLFDREVQACSNISGTGKHKKKQLDPLLIYGIYCHLVHNFGITEKDWTRLKQNIDSKCRTAFRRKIKGLPLLPKGGNPGHRSLEGKVSNKVGDIHGEMDSFSVNIPCDTVLSTVSAEETEEASLVLQPSESDVAENVLQRVIRESELIQTEHGNIQVLHATPEVLAEIQQTHQIQVLTDGHILATPVEENDKFILTGESQIQEDEDT